MLAIHPPKLAPLIYLLRASTYSDHRLPCPALPCPVLSCPALSLAYPWPVADGRDGVALDLGGV